MKHYLLTILSTSLLILLFSYTAFSKILHFKKFIQQLSESPLIHQNGAAIVASLIIVTEVMIVLLLLFGITRRTGLYLSLLLLTVFTVYLLYITGFAKHVPCSCGGVISVFNWKQHIVFNLFFIAICISGIMTYPKEIKILRNQG